MNLTWVLVLILPLLAGCAEDTSRTVSVELVAENQDDFFANVRLYAVDRGAADDGSDAWLPVRLDANLDPGERTSGPGLLVVRDDDPAALHFWASVYDATSVQYEEYAAVPESCLESVSWSVALVWSGTIEVDVTCLES